jgi:hypothetical protein
VKHICSIACFDPCGDIVKDLFELLFRYTSLYWTIPDENLWFVIHLLGGCTADYSIENWFCAGWSKSHATHSWHMFYLSKNKLHWNQKTKTMLYYVLEMSTAFSNACIQSFSHVWCNPVKSFCSDRMVHQMRYCQFICGTGESGIISQNSFWKVN